MCYNSLKAIEREPLPAVLGLQISGEPTPGQEIYAGGFCINGTTSLKFAWLRGAEDSCMTYIQGAEQANYKLTEDDVDLYLAVEVLPFDGQARKGAAVRIIANDHRKISHSSQRGKRKLPSDMVNQQSSSP